MANLTSRRSLLAASVGLASGASAATTPPPNIVIILADDLGYGDIGAYNPDSRIPTPNVDGLAREGVRFTDAHTPCAVCSPTRYGLLTGRYPWRSELKSRVLWPWDKPLIEKERLTLPAMLRTRGYHTACIGKWHLGWDWPTTDGSKVNSLVGIGDPQREIRNEFAKKVRFDQPIAEGPLTRGFDSYYGVDLPNFPPYAFIENDRLLTEPSQQKPDSMFGWPGAMTPGWRLENVLPALTRRAVAHIENRGARQSPYFLYLPLTAPHTPIAPDDPFLGKSRAGRYGDFVYQVDWSVGQVMDAIRRSPAAANTLVIFTSDNGPENLTYPVLKEFDHASAGSLRGAKRMLWEGGHRVPFLAWGAGVPSGKVEDEVVCLTDLMATAANMVGYRLPPGAAEDSYDIGGALFGKPRAAPIREATVHHSLSNEYALRQGDWVYIESNDSWSAAEPDWWRARRSLAKPEHGEALYRLTDDLGETKNLVAQQPERVARMRALLMKYKREDRSVPAR
ncbi:MAG: arylsulfatase [Bryobacteraceae bacterium]